MRGRFALPAAVAAVAIAAACGGERETRTVVADDVTGVDILVAYPPAFGLDQLRITGTLGSSEAFAPGLVPESPTPLTAGVNDVVLLLDDALAGETLTIRVAGLATGVELIHGTSAVAVQLQTLVSALVTLAPVGVDVCSNGVDDDGDGQADFPADPGCSSAADGDEHDATLVCDDGIDQDGDTYADFPADPGCSNLSDTSELGPPGRECDNGEDDDLDTFVDYPDDPECTSPTDNKED